MIKIVLIVAGVILGYIVLKTIIQEIIKCGIRGLFTALPKVLKEILLFIPKLIKNVFKVIFGFLKEFFKALKICLSRG